MKKFYLLTVLLFALAGSRLHVLVAKNTGRQVKNNAFQVGEKLRYEVGWKGAVAGEAILHVQELGSRRKRPAYKIVCNASTNAAIDLIFPVRDRYESWMDQEALSSLGFAERIEEGDHRRQTDIFIDPFSGAYTGRKMRPNKNATPEKFQGRFVPYIQDLLSAIYYVRAQNLEEGKQITFPVASGENVIQAAVIVRHRETIETPAGKFSCLVAEPLKKTDRGYEALSKSKILIWLTNDQKHIPVKITAQLPIGAIDAVLIKN